MIGTAMASSLAGAILAFTGLVTSQSLAHPASVTLGPKTAYLNGCFNDGAGKGRALQTRIRDVKLTATDCVKQGIQRGYSFAGVENGNECWVGNWINPGSHKIDGTDSKCVTPCHDGAGTTETCGGDRALQIYTIDPPANPPQPKVTRNGGTLQGCYADIADPKLRKLPVSFGYIKNDEECVKLVHDKNLPSPGPPALLFAGTEDGRECWGGWLTPEELEATPHQKLGDSECSQACNGDSQEHCGNGLKIQVYYVPVLLAA